MSTTTRTEWGVVYPNGRVLVFQSRADAQSEIDHLAMAGVGTSLKTRTLQVPAWEDPS